MSTVCPEIHKPHNLVNPHGPHRTAGLVTCLDLWPHPEYVRNAVAFRTLQQYSRSDGVIWSNNVNLFLSENGTDFIDFFPQDFIYLFIYKQACTGTVLIPCMTNQYVFLAENETFAWQPPCKVKSVSNSGTFSVFLPNYASSQKLSTKLLVSES